MFFLTPNRNTFLENLSSQKDFWLALRLSARKYEIKENSDVHRDVWTNIQKLYAKIIFSKKQKNSKSKYKILNHLYFSTNFVFWVLRQGVLACVFYYYYYYYYYYSSLVNHGGRHFYSRRHKKASYGPVLRNNHYKSPNNTDTAQKMNFSIKDFLIPQ